MKLIEVETNAKKANLSNDAKMNIKLSCFLCLFTY